MSVNTISTANLSNFQKNQPGTHYFFEFTGHPGRIYIDHLEFAADRSIMRVGDHVSSALESPILIYPKGSLYPLHNILHQHQTYGDGNKPKLRECLIKMETNQNGKIITYIKYRLLRLEIVRAKLYIQGADYYEFGFEDGDRFFD